MTTGAGTGIVYRSGSARLPTAFGEFAVTVYRDRENKEHLAVCMGNLEGPPPLVRIHSECLTGDVFGSVRCDCGEQLKTALRHISQDRRGLLLYLRQEGRGIGLRNKIRAYALQDRGMDTVEANLYLGFPVDGRSYTNASAILRDLGVQSVRLATNNPEKVKALESGGIRVVERVRFQIKPGPENYAYLQTKASKMGHLFDPTLIPHRPFEDSLSQEAHGVLARLIARLREAEKRDDGLPLVTLSYAQSLDGSIAARPDERLQLSNPQSQRLTHQLRSVHDAVLVGINTVLTDDPQLTVRLVAGKNPQPVILDGRLRTPLNARLLRSSGLTPIIATCEGASAAREKRLCKAGARVLRLQSRPNRRIDLQSMLRNLYDMGIRSLMVEGGAQVITEFLSSNLVDQMIVTIAPKIVGGLRAIQPLSSAGQIFDRGTLTNIQYESFGEDIVVYADVERDCRTTGKENPAMTASAAARR